MPSAPSGATPLAAPTADASTFAASAVVVAVDTGILAGAIFATLDSPTSAAVSTTAQTFDLSNDLMGSTPSFSLYLKQQFDGQTLVMRLNKVVSGKMNLPFKNDDFALYDFEAEALDDGTGSLGYMCLY